MGQKPTSGRKLKNSRQVPIKIDSEDAWSASQFRAQDMESDRRDPQPGPVEKRDRTAR